PSVRLCLESLEDRTVPATFLVATTVDGGAGSLRQAILDANASSGADTIAVASGTYNLTLGELDITDDLTITGAGGIDGTFINAAGLDRVFQVIGNATLSKLGIEGGKASQGAGILVQGGNVTLSDLSIAGNLASQGGGIFVDGGNVTVAH